MEKKINFDVGDRVFYAGEWCKVIWRQGFMLLFEHPKGYPKSNYWFVKSVELHDNKLYLFIASSKVKGEHQERIK